MPPTYVPTGRLCAVILAVTLLMVCPCAYQTTEINQPVAVFQQFINDSFNAHTGAYLTSIQSNAIWGGLLGSTGLAGIFASLFIHSAAKRFGVRKTLLVSCNVCNIGAALCELLSKRANSFELLILGQMLGSGMAWSFALALGAVYLTELSPPNLRGAAGTSMSVGNFLGILLSYILGLDDIMGTDALWPYYASLTLGISVICLLLTPFFPDSPKEIYIKTGNRQKAIEQIEKFYGSQWDSGAMIKDFEEENHQTADKFLASHILSVPHLRQPMIVASVASVFAVSCGPMMTLIFSTSIFGLLLPGNGTDLYLESRRAELATVAMAVPMPLLVVAASIAVEKCGRRPLIIGVGIVMTVCLLGYSILGHISLLINSEAMGYAAFACLIINSWISPFGPMTVGLFISSELLPQSARPIASAICIAIVGLAYMAGGFILPPLQTELQVFGAGPWAVFIVMGIPSIFCLIYLHFKLPETKGIPVNEIVNIWVVKEQEDTCGSTTTCIGQLDHCAHTKL